MCAAPQVPMWRLRFSGLVLLVLVAPAWLQSHHPCGATLTTSLFVSSLTLRALATSTLQTSPEDECVSQVVSALQQSCPSAGSSSSGSLTASQQEDAARKLVSREFGSCMDAVRDQALNGSKTGYVMVPSRYLPVLRDMASKFNAANPSSSIQLLPVEETQVLQEVLYSLGSDLAETKDGLVVASGSTFTLQSVGPLVNLSAPLDASAALLDSQLDPCTADGKALFGRAQNPIWGMGMPLNASDLPQHLLNASMFAGSPYYVTLDGTAMLMYYRTDVLRNHSVDRPPTTWEQVLRVAQLVNGTDMDGDGQPDFALCIERDPDCSFSSALAMVVAPYLQYEGTSQGMLFDPKTMSPLFNSSGVLSPLSLFQQLLTGYTLMRSNVDVSLGSDDCPTYAGADFGAGRCAMTFSRGYLFKAMEMGVAPNSFCFNDSSPVRELYGVTWLPGSSSVMNRTSGELVPCDSVLCPHGMGGQPEEAGLSEAGQPQWVNRAPFLPRAALLGAISNSTALSDRALVLDFLVMVSTANLELALNRTAPVLPFRWSSLDASEAQLDVWQTAGYQRGSVQDYLAATGATLSHGNIAVDVDMPKNTVIRSLLGTAGLNLTAGMAVADVAVALNQALVSQVVENAASCPKWLKFLEYAYGASIGYEPESDDTTPTSSGSIPAVSLAVPIASTVVVLILSIIYEVKKHRKHRSLFGKVVAPGANEDTTLLITDIQDSTTLWELLDSTVMDEAIKQHHKCIRKLLLKHSGYESATEGDSFILAFHCPEDALLFAMEAQVALLECEWPTALMQCQICKTVYVVQVEPEKVKAMGVVMGELPAATEPSLAIANGAGAMGTASGSNEDVNPQSQSSLLSSSAKDNTATAESGATGAAGAQQQGGAAAARNSTSGGSGGQASGSHLAPPSFAPASPAPNGLHAPMSPSGTASNTFIAACRNAWKEATGSTPNSVLIFRGLRVRMGMHTGISNEADVAYNKAAARMHYSGEIIMNSKAVSDAAAGGMILLSEHTYKRLPMERLWDKAMVMHIGSYVLKETCSPWELYQATGRRLMGRLGVLARMRFKAQLSQGVLAAPLGHVSVVFMNVVGASTLVDWNPDVARSALQLFQDEAMSGLQTYNGYVVESSDDQVLAVFNHAAEALLWALETHRALLHQHDWPLELLDHELGEELVVGDTVVFRGLRLKTGVDVGEVIGEVDAMTGRICYRGKVVNRAARIVQTASSNQVLCSGDVWAEAQAQRHLTGLAMAMDSVQAERLGPFKLRGIMEKVELLHCRASPPPPLSMMSLGHPGDQLDEGVDFDHHLPVLGHLVDTWPGLNDMQLYPPPNDDDPSGAPRLSVSGHLQEFRLHSHSGGGNGSTAGVMLGQAQTQPQPIPVPVDFKSNPLHDGSVSGVSVASAWLQGHHTHDTPSRVLSHLPALAQQLQGAQQQQHGSRSGSMIGSWRAAVGSPVGHTGGSDDLHYGGTLWPRAVPLASHGEEDGRDAVAAAVGAGGNGAALTPGSSDDDSSTPCRRGETAAAAAGQEPTACQQGDACGSTEVPPPPPGFKGPRAPAGRLERMPTDGDVSPAVVVVPLQAPSAVATAAGDTTATATGPS